MGRKVPARLVPAPNQPGVFEATYVPDAEGPCLIEVLQGQQHVPRSPITQYVLPACEPLKVRATGEGVKPTRPEGVPAGKTTTFQVDTREAGSGDLELTVTVSPFVILHALFAITIYWFKQIHFHLETIKINYRKVCLS